MGIISSFRDLWRNIRQWTWHHVVAFLLTFFAYASFHACRKSFSNIKDVWEKSHCPQNITNPMFPYEKWQSETLFTNEKHADQFLGQLDFLFLIAYGIGLFISGVIGDRINLCYFLAFGMCSSAIVTFFFGYVGELLAVENLYYYRVLYFINGLCQSTGWPATVAIMGNWFSKSSGGLVFGFWSANASVGNIIGSLIVAAVLDYGYEVGMLLNSIFLFCMGVIVFFCLILHPNDVGLDSPDVSEKVKSSIISEEEHIVVEVKQPKAIGFFQALMIPGVIPYSLSYACLKLVNYSFFFWLPTYLVQALHWQSTLSDKLSNFYDVGGILGGIFVGLISDIMGTRSPAVGTSLLLSSGALYLYSAYGTTYTINVTLMIITGIFVGGAANTISTAITADLGKHEKIAGSSEALATVTGIIDGTGSVGAAIGQYMVGAIEDHWNWHAVFYFLIIMAILSLVCIIPMIVNDFRFMARRRREKKGLYDVLTEQQVSDGE